MGLIVFGFKWFCRNDDLSEWIQVKAKAMKKRLFEELVYWFTLIVVKHFFLKETVKNERMDKYKELKLIVLRDLD